MNICLEPKILTHCVGDVFLDDISNNLEEPENKTKKKRKFNSGVPKGRKREKIRILNDVIILSETLIH